MTPKEIQEQSRYSFLMEWVEDALRHTSLLVSISINDDSDNERTAFEVIIKNEINLNKTTVVLQVSDDDGDSPSIEILEGEDFENCDIEDFLRHLFILQFLYS